MVVAETEALAVRTPDPATASAGEFGAHRARRRHAWMVFEVGPTSDAKDWVVRGHGRANVVFGYVGTVACLVGKVLRVPKRKVERVSQNEKHRLLQDAVWAGVPGMLLQDEMAKSWHYMNNIIGPTLGMQFVRDGCIVDVPSSLQRDLNIEDRGHLLPDSTLFSTADDGNSGGYGPTLSIELKPKCGFLPSCSSENPKGNIPKFALQQLMKLKQGRIDSYSKYNPLDMFSGNPKRMRKAFYELLKTPQNNLRLFVNGEPVCSGRSGLLDPKVEQLVKSVIGDTKVSVWDILIDVFITLLLKEGILSRILSLQKLDRFDIEVIFELYQQLMGLSDDMLEKLKVSSVVGNPGCTELGFDQADRRPCRSQGVDEARDAAAHEDTSINPSCEIVNNGGVLSNSGCWSSYDRGMMCWQSAANFQRYLKHVRDYLISATAKDCSVFVTLRWLNRGSMSVEGVGGGCVDGQEEKGSKFIKFGGGGLLMYKIVVADLDIKHVSKISNHFSIDQTLQQLFRDVQRDNGKKGKDLM